MRILHCIGSFVNGGIETLLTNVVNRQVTDGHEVAVMIVTEKWSQQMIDALDGRVTVFYVDKPVGSRNPWYWVRITRYYKSFHADILHLHGPGSERLFVPKNRGERRILTLHNEVNIGSFSSTVDRYIAISQCVFEAFKQKTGHDNCVVCYNGVDIDAFKRKTIYKPNPHRIVAVGRILFEVKAQDLIVEAFGKLPPQIRRDIHLDIWGDGVDLQRLHVLVQELGVGDCVTVAGNVTNAYVRDHLCDYDLLLCASHHEGLGITAIEGMAAGVPLLLSDASGYLEVTDNGVHGTHFRHSDADAIRDEVVHACCNYASLCDKAIGAAEYARRRFSIERHVQHLAEIYARS